MGRSVATFWLGLGVLAGVSGCGYTLSHRLKDTFAKNRTVFVPVFDNNTNETGAESVFTNALIRELQSRGEVIVTHRQPGALELHGSIEGIGYAPTAFTAFGFQGLEADRRLPSEVGVGVSIYLTLQDPANGKVLWSKGFSGYRRVSLPVNRTYDFQAPSSLGLQTQSLVDSEYSEIAGDIMRDVYDEMVELF